MSINTGTFLIIGGSEQDRLDRAKELCDLENFKPIPDLKVLDTEPGKKSIGIQQARKASQFLHEKPYANSNKILIINKAQLLTHQAQNALLKTLEEPPIYSLIIVLVDKEKALLPTVISRCKIIRLMKLHNQINVKDQLEKSPLPNNISGMLTWAKETSKEDTEDIIDILKKQIMWWRKAGNSLGKMETHNIRLTLKVITDLENININKSLLLDYYALNLLFKD